MVKKAQKRSRSVSEKDDNKINNNGTQEQQQQQKAGKKEEAVPHVVALEEKKEKKEEEEELMVPEWKVHRRDTASSTAVMTNRQKCIVLGGRNMSAKLRHLLLDLRNLMPHSREHPKMGGSGGAQSHHFGHDLVEICNLHQCNSFLYMDPHRNDVQYMWVGQAPAGPSVKMQLTNIHTADEIRMAGNCLKYSRPLLHFDRAFETTPHLRVVKTLLHMIFNVPRYHPKSKPFIDRIMSFFWLDGHIWVRNYQIIYPSTVNVNLKTDRTSVKTAAAVTAAEVLPTLGLGQEKGSPSLLEIGPRFTLEPVMILNGSCQGEVVWRSGTAQTPTAQRRDRKMRHVEKQMQNERIKEMSATHRAKLPAPTPDPLDMLFK